MLVLALFATGCSSGSDGGGQGGTSGSRGAGGTGGTTGIAGGTGAGGATGLGGASGTGGVGGSGTAGAGGRAGASGTAGVSGLGGAGGRGTAGTNGTAGGKGSGAGAGGIGTGGTAGPGGVGGNAGANGIAGASGGAVATALVDDDQSDNNSSVANPTASPSDTLFPKLLQGEGINFRTVVSTSDSYPASSDLAGYTNVAWYTGATMHTVSISQQQALADWLDSGNKRLIIFSEELQFNVGGNWTSAPNSFFSTYVGAAGTLAYAYSYVLQTALNNTNYVATGVAGTPFAALTFMITENTPIASNAEVVNPATGTDALVTVSVDPTSAGSDSPTPVVVGHTKGTSTIVYVGLPIEDISGTQNSQQQFFHATLRYLGIVN